MKAALVKIDITPTTNVWLDGMIRKHESIGVHDPIFARVLVLSNEKDVKNICVIISVDVCGLIQDDVNPIRQTINRKFAIPQDNIIIAATHTHSGPSTIGFFNKKETEYLKELSDKIVNAVGQAITNLKPALVGCDSGEEKTISHYRRLLSDEGKVIMNWEPFPPERIVRVLGEIDPEVGVLKIVDAQEPKKIIGILFNHAGHPNVFSGDNYFISADYPGYACDLIEKKFNCVAMFINGAQGTMDIDGLKDRDWEGIVRIGTALANSVIKTADKIHCTDNSHPFAFSAKYPIPKRKITKDELAWAKKILAVTKGTVKAMADGVGDDYKALLYKKIYDADFDKINVEQICFIVDNSAFITFPGEVFTEIGMKIKAKSPFKHTYFLGLANGRTGYIPTKEAISQGGYEVDTRWTQAETEDILIEKSLDLLNKAYEEYKTISGRNK